MNNENPKTDESRLGDLLRQARLFPPLPPRFQENVWRRIESTNAPAAQIQNWLDKLAGWLLRPRLALATAVVLIVAGIGLGWNHGKRDNRHQAQARYLAAVAPNILR